MLLELVVGCNKVSYIYINKKKIKCITKFTIQIELER